MIAGFVTSCDKEETEGNVSSSKKLVKVEEANYSYELIYDKDGKCTSYVEYEKNVKGETTTFKYEGNKIVEETFLEDGDLRVTTTMTFNSNGYLETSTVVNGESGAEKTVYEYDNAGQLISEKTDDEEDDYHTVTTYEWKDGNIVKASIVETEDGESYSYSVNFAYTNASTTTPIENKVGVTVGQIQDGFYPMSAKMGKAPKNFPVTLTYVAEEGKVVTTLTWEFDGDGYPTKLSDKSGNNTSIMTLTWE